MLDVPDNQVLQGVTAMSRTTVLTQHTCRSLGPITVRGGTSGGVDPVIHYPD